MLENFKKYKLYYIISIVVVLLAVIGFTFAYFEGLFTNNASIDTNVTFGGNYKFETSGNDTISIDIDALSMYQDTSDKLVGEITQNVVVSLTNTDDLDRRCTYDLIWAWDSSFDHYTISQAGIKEFTITVNGNEMQLPNYTSDELILLSSKVESTSTSKVTNTHSFSIKFYNLKDVDQAIHAGKEYVGNIKVNNVICKELTLSDVVLFLADGSERQSSQTNGGVYRVINPEVNVPSPTTYTKLTQSEYGNVTEYQGTGISTLPSAGTTLSEIMFDYNSSDNTYSNDVTNMATSSYYHMVVPVEENASYQICYKVTTAGETNYLYAYITDETSSYIGYEKLSIRLNSVVTRYTCTDLGYLTEGQGIRIINGTYTTKAAVTFYLQKSTEMTSNGNAGVRYQGKNPNNYVQFNGTELWRIIGVFEGSTIGLEEGKYYTKIIKHESIGNKYWDESGLNNWANASLNTYLTNTYLPSIETSSSDMIAQDVTYYLGGVPSPAYYTPAQFYQAERGNVGGAAAPTVVTHQNEIGLMYPSDYGYAMYAGSSNNVCNTDLVIHNYTISNLKCANYDWMFLNTDERTISPYAYNSSSAFYVHSSGIVLYSGVGIGYAVRPVLYLEASVGIESGEGTLGSPYILK